ncbi:MAG: trypsin-like serine peptidase, partial [Actinomycetota bacterium]
MALVLVCLLGSTLFASAAPASSNDRSTTRKVASFDVQQHGQRFWRRVARTAKPLAGEVVRRQPTAARTSGADDEVGTPYSVPPQAPTAPVAPEAKRSTSTRQRERVPSGRAAALPDPIPFTLSEIANVTAYPNVTHGKIFGEMVVDGARQRFVCSGTIVSSQNQSTVATAGHCVYDPDESVGVSAISFAPGYRNEVAPFGFWEAEKVYSTPRWTQSGDHRYDAAMLVIDQGSRPDPIQETFGSRGISFNRSPLQMFDAYGYPAGPPFDGEKLWMCDSEQSVPDDNYPSTPVPPLGMGCDMTGGSSGGGWV